jgi:hypothetical protein
MQSGRGKGEAGDLGTLGAANHKSTMERAAGGGSRGSSDLERDGKGKEGGLGILFVCVPNHYHKLAWGVNSSASHTREGVKWAKGFI